MPITPNTKFDHYEILGPLGAGGMGEVYRAKDSRLDREVAIKVLPADLANDPERMRCNYLSRLFELFLDLFNDQG